MNSCYMRRSWGIPVNKQMLTGLLEFNWGRLGLSLLFLYGCFAVWIFFFADRMIFLPQPSSYEDTRKIIKLKTRDNSQISAVYLPQEAATYTILYIHGNAEDLGDIRSVLERLQDQGFNVFAYDYHGYGTSEGKPSEKNAYEDIDAAYDYLTVQLKIPPEHILVYGRSVGGGSGVDLAVRKPLGGLILEGSFTTAFRVVIPIRILPFDKFTNIDKIKKVNCPVLVMHGVRDEIVPFQHGEALFAAAPSPKLSLWVDEAGHNDFVRIAGERLDKVLREFVQLIEEK